MKLSEAIILGSLIRPQAYGSYFTRTGSCASGAAIEASGYKNKQLNSWTEVEWFPTYRALLNTPCPVCQKIPLRKDTHPIPHLNDIHKWTRPQIAAWVATQESLLAPTSCEQGEQVGIDKVLAL